MAQLAIRHLVTVECFPRYGVVTINTSGAVQVKTFASIHRTTTLHRPKDFVVHIVITSQKEIRD